MVNIKKFVKEKYWIIALFSIFIFSFVLNMYVLTRYSLSYGIDGAFYNYQIVSILKTGFPLTSDPPLAYYLLTPFTLIGNDFFGLKIGTAFFGAILAFPAYYLTELYDNKKPRNQNNRNFKISSSKVPALLSAFLITVNVNYFTMVGTYGILQNLVGVLFLVLLMYFSIKWMQDTRGNVKYGIITLILLGCNVLTHIYTGALAVVLFFSMLLFTVFYKKYSTGKVPWFDIKILGVLSLVIAGTFLVLFAVYPVMFSKFSTFISFFGVSTDSMSNIGGMASPNNGYNYFCSIPYFLGIFAAIMLLKNGLKERLNNQERIDKITLSTWSYLVLAAVMAVLTFMSSEYQSRFLLLSFVPIALLVPLGLKYVESEIISKKPSYNKQISLLIAGIAIIFALSSFYTASTVFSSVGPSITEAQYAELQAIKENSTALGINNNTVLASSDFTTHYWVEYVFGKNVELNVLQNSAGNSSGNQTNQSNQTVYYISLSSNSTMDKSNQNNQMKLMGGSNSPGSFFLPYGPSLLNSLDVVKIGNQTQNQNSNHMPGNGPGFNDTNRPNGTMNGTAPQNMQNGTLNSTMGNGTAPPDMQNGTQAPGMNNGTMPQGMQNNTQMPQTNSSTGQFMPGGNFNGRSPGSNSLSALASSGTLVYSGDYVKVYKISL